MSGRRLIIIIFPLISNLGFVAPLDGYSGGCAGVTCRPGRSCLAHPPGVVQCVCKHHCPKNWKPVCGSDGVSYSSHCELHRVACVQERHISPSHKGPCRADQEALIARREFIHQLSLWDEEEEQDDTIPKISPPDVCSQNDRDRLREFIIDWFQTSAKKQSWYSPGMSPGEELWGHFLAILTHGGDRAIDGGEDGGASTLDNQTGEDGEDSTLGKGADSTLDTKRGVDARFSTLDSEEWGRYLASLGSPGHSMERQRQLCLAALVEEGDRDMDWRLSFSEFRRLLSSTYLPSRAVCSLRSGNYEDGAETEMDCNQCVCACGKWVCTSKVCAKDLKLPEETQKIQQNYRTRYWAEVENQKSQQNYRTSYWEQEEGENPEDDPDVQNIRWF